MIDSTTTLESSTASDRAAEHTFSGDFQQLIKSRLTFLVVITTFVGFCLASHGALEWARLFHTVMGTALVAAAAAAFNQVFEYRVDRMMERTRHRPIAAARMSRTTGALLGGAMAFIGLLQLALTTNFIAVYLAATSFFIYILLYTPMKRRTSFCVTVGAVSGAIPPVIGWVAIEGNNAPFGVGAWVLFGILFAWQMPHFLAIAWMYRDEYAQAGFVMLPRWDSTGVWTALQALAYTLVLTAVTVVPFITGEAGVIYLVGASLANLLMLVCSVLFLLQRNRNSARKLFFASILYLPVLLCLMVFLRA